MAILVAATQFRIFINSTSLQPRIVSGLSPKLTAEAQTFLLEMLKPCPSQRWSAHTALKHKFLLATGSDHVGIKVQEVASLIGSAVVEGRCKANTS